jgi:hypothetical protein
VAELHANALDYIRHAPNLEWRSWSSIIDYADRSVSLAAWLSKFVYLILSGYSRCHG